MSRGTSLRLQLRPSRTLAAALTVVHLAGAACLVAVLPGVAGIAAGGLLAALGMAAAWSRALLRGDGAVRALDLGPEGEAVLGLADGRQVPGRVAPRRHVTRLWVVLPLRGTAQRNILVAADMLAPDAFRRLRLWALWGRTVRPGGA